MDGKMILGIGGGLAIGTLLGFGVGYYIVGDEIQKKYLDEIDMLNEELRKHKLELDNMKNLYEETSKIDPPAMKPKEPPKYDIPEEHKKDYTIYSKKISELNYEYEQNCIADMNNMDDVDSDCPPDDEPIDYDDPDDEDWETRKAEEELEDEMWYETVQNYIDKHINDPIVLGNDRIDDDCPDIHLRTGTWGTEELYWFVGDDVITDDHGNLIDEEECIGHKLRQMHWLKGTQDYVWVRNCNKEVDYKINRELGTSEDYWIKGISEE